MSRLASPFHSRQVVADLVLVRSMSVHLRPSFVRACSFLLALLTTLAVATYFWQDYHEDHGWTRDYIVSLAIPLTIVPFVVCAMFLSKRLEFSDSDFMIQFPFRRLHRIDWEDLENYGSGPNVFMIQFSGIGTFQILPQAFRRSEWRRLTTFLATTFPERKASGYFGHRMFRWPPHNTIACAPVRPFNR